MNSAVAENRRAESRNRILFIAKHWIDVQRCFDHSAEGVDSKLGGVNRFMAVADVIDHFLSESTPSAL